MFNHTIVYNDNISVSEELETHTIDAFTKLEKFIGENPVEFRTIYSKEGSSFKVHSHGLFAGIQYDAHVINDDIYKGIDLMVSKLESQFRKAKNKRINIERETSTQTEDVTDHE